MVKILIIDDDADVRAMLGRLLSRYGCQTWGAQNGTEGQQMALRDQPDLILLDIMMDGQDGYETCTNLRAAGYRGTIFMLSAIRGAEGRPRAIECGADGYYQKPVSAGVLKAQVLAMQNPTAEPPVSTIQA